MQTIIYIKSKNVFMFYNVIYIFYFIRPNCEWDIVKYVITSLFVDLDPVIAPAVEINIIKTYPRNSSNRNSFDLFLFYKRTRKKESRTRRSACYMIWQCQQKSLYIIYPCRLLLCWNGLFSLRRPSPIKNY